MFAAFAGVEPDDLIGMSDRDMPWADDAEFGADWFIDWDAHVVDTGEPVFGIVERLRRARGDVRWVETNKVPLRDLDGEVIGVLGTFEDVTERRAAEEQLKRTLAELDERVQQRTTRPRAGQREPATRGRRSRSGAGRGAPATRLRRGVARHREPRCRRRSTCPR